MVALVLFQFVGLIFGSGAPCAPAHQLHEPQVLNLFSFADANATKKGPGP